MRPLLVVSLQRLQQLQREAAVEEKVTRLVVFCLEFFLRSVAQRRLFPHDGNQSGTTVWRAQLVFIPCTSGNTRRHSRRSNCICFAHIPLPLRR